MELNRQLISVIVPHLNQPDALDACLASIRTQTIDDALYEIIVVDNGSTRLPENVVARHPGVRLLHETRPGPGPARNAGFRQARGDIFAFIDADCRAHPGWLSSALQSLHAAPAGTILGGDVRIWRGSARPTAIEAYECVFAYRFKLYIEQHGYCGTGNLVVRRETFAAVGPFAGIQCAEDMDWGARASAAGFRFRYVPEMIVYHPARRSLRELYEKWDRQTWHYLHMAKGKPGWAARWTLRALAILVSPAVDVVKVLGSDRIEGPVARLKAILVLIAVRAHRARTMLSLLRGRGGVRWNNEATVGTQRARSE